VRDGLKGPSGRGGAQDQPIAEGVLLRDHRIHVVAQDDGSVPALRALEAAVGAAEHDVPFERGSLTRLRAIAEPTWDVWERAAFLRLLRVGENAVPVFEALDHEGVLVRLVPEWEHVRFRPQRNAYHRFTVDRHLLEAVVECARLLDAGDRDRDQFDHHDVDAVVARACRRPELLLLGALLHDIAKGQPGDHSEVGAETAMAFARRIGLDSEGREILVWLVRNHLLMADVATRRDLADATVADNVAAACANDPERLRLLYLLTIGDSRATGPAAWSPAKASLVRDLFTKAAASIERGEARMLVVERRQSLADRLGDERAEKLLGRLPDGYVLAFDPETMGAHEELLACAPTARCDRTEESLRVTVAADDRPGLLATLAGALTLCGLNVLEANLFGTTDGLALDIFRAADPFGRVTDADGEAHVVQVIHDALADDVDLETRVEERRRAYAVSGGDDAEVRVVVDNEASDTDTVVEVHAADDVGLLYRLAWTLAEVPVDVRVAKVATLGQRVVDVFYVRDASGRKLEPHAAKEVRAALEACLAG
jgi:[protein-PII] uridylyltransferase